MGHTDYQTVDTVAIVTMSNPPASLFDEELSDHLLADFERASEEGRRALILQADGAAFSGGADVSMFRARTISEARELLGRSLPLIAAIEDAPFPVIAAVHGVCLAAGLELALACDLVVAEESARFAQVESMIGATTFLGGVYRLAERCGPARAREITFGAEQYTAATFERWNIINRVVPDGELREHAFGWAQRLAKGPTAAHAVTKRLVRYGQAHGPREADRYLLDAATPLFESHDMQHAVGELLSHGARKFRANHDQLVFENR
jgi:enoyl-CoA hydratase/carnithine racemase